MMWSRALSQSPSARRLMEGPVREGLVLGHRYLQFGGYVVALTPPDDPRMPNGIESPVQMEPGDGARIGGGALFVNGVAILPGSGWNPRPCPQTLLHAVPSFVPDPIALAGRGEGLTPAGDDLLIGYTAGLVLFQHARRLAVAVAAAAGSRTTALSRTLLVHAAQGELPEPAHAFLGTGDPAPLLRFGHTSGRWMILGLALACGIRGSRVGGTRIATVRIGLIPSTAPHWGVPSGDGGFEVHVHDLEVHEPEAVPG